MDVESWQSFDFGSVGNVEYFDNMAWEKMMSEFTMPHS
jgi:hypothetical protein